MYKIVSWETGEILEECVKLSIAKRHCRKLGYVDNGHPTNYSPVAYVADADGYVVYNPRFKRGK